MKFRYVGPSEGAVNYRGTVFSADAITQVMDEDLCARLQAHAHFEEVSDEEFKKQIAAEKKKAAKALKDREKKKKEAEAVEESEEDGED